MKILLMMSSRNNLFHSTRFNSYPRRIGGAKVGLFQAGVAITLNVLCSGVKILKSIWIQKFAAKKACFILATSFLQFLLIIAFGRKPLRNITAQHSFRKRFRHMKEAHKLGNSFFVILCQQWRQYLLIWCEDVLKNMNFK